MSSNLASIDILKLHDKVCEELDQTQFSRQTTLANRNFLSEKLQSSGQLIPSFRKRELCRQIADLDCKLAQSNVNVNLQEYMFLVDPLILQFKTLVTIPKPAFCAKKESLSVLNSLVRKRVLLAKKYLHIVSKYCDVCTIFPEVYQSTLCEFKCECMEPDLIENEHALACTRCGVEFGILDNQSSFKDIHRVNMSVKYKYERAAHFKDAVYQFQGKQNKRISKDVYNKIEQELVKYNMLVDSKDPSIRYKNITRRNLLMFLEHTNYSRHYEDVNLIAKHYGKEIPQIAHLERKLFEAFDQVLSVYEKLENIQRSNFLNNQYVLYQLLRMMKYPCSKDQFNLIESKERLREHDDIFSQICKQLEWNFQAVA